jgi:hypothetical protein
MKYRNGHHIQLMNKYLGYTLFVPFIAIQEEAKEAWKHLFPLITT